jgi:poly-gamma-glutamate synthesis protein (capsule biosynthesis protein)
MMFRAPPGAEKALKSANFSILSLANNHTLNFGKEGILKTFYYLKKTKIKFVGAGENKKEAYNHTIIEKNGTKFAFLAYSNGRLVPSFYEASSKRPGIAFDNKQKMISAVRTANKEADFVIVSMHLGQEYKSTPNSYQKSFARTAIDNGADLVLGHHPHVIQSIEKYKGRYIFYSLGNFIFDQMWSQSTREGLMVKLLFKNNKVTLVEIKPILVENYSQPRILQGGTAKKVLNRIKKNF